MLNIDKTEDRKNYIGGIDAPVIVLPNPKWKTKYQLWMEKTGRAEPKDISIHSLSIFLHNIPNEDMQSNNIINAFRQVYSKFEKMIKYYKTLEV